MTPAERKLLQTRHSNARSSVDEARRIFKNASDTLNSAEKELRDVGALVAEASKEFIVSEHALLRFFQRVQGADLNAAVESLTAEIKPLVDTLGDGTYPLNKTAPGFVAVVRQKTIVTIENRRIDYALLR